MANKYISLLSGILTQVEGLVTSTGASDAGKIVALDSGGKLDSTVLPTGVGAETKSYPTSENLSAGDLVNIYDASGTATARLADASNGRRAMGFVLAASTSPGAAIVYFEGLNNQLTGLTIGVPYYLDNASAGDITATAPSTAGHIVQEIGTAVSATELTFEAQRQVVLA
jgi:hypothetical protein